ncbi:MAG: hypothetical protein WCD35_02445 [Mycobacteriales bacterium]
MALQLSELAQQVLNQTRIVTNGPLLGPGEALHLDVVPGGAAFVNELSGLIATSPLTAELDLTASYQVKRGGMDVTATTLRTPAKPATGPELLSVAFLLPPRLRTVVAGRTVLAAPPLVPPSLDCEVVVTLVVSAPGLTPVTKSISVPFTTAQVDVPAIPPAVCVMCPDAGWSGQNTVLLVAPGTGAEVASAIELCNEVVRILGTLQPVASLIADAVKPVQKVLDVLDDVPAPQSSNAARVDLNDFEDLDAWIDTGLDDVMTSFIAVGPTGTRIRFADEWSHGFWASGGRTFELVDLLELSMTVEGQYVRDQLGISDSDLTALAAQLTPLLGGAQLGLGVALCHNFDDGSVPAALRTFDGGDSLNDDIGVVQWFVP